MPKSAFCASSQAKACAFAILAALTGSKPPPSHLLDAGYTFLAGNDAVVHAAAFEPAGGTIRLSGSFPAKVDASVDLRRKTVREAAGWYDAFTHDVFG